MIGLRPQCCSWMLGQRDVVARDAPDLAVGVIVMRTDQTVRLRWSCACSARRRRYWDLLVRVDVVMSFVDLASRARSCRVSLWTYARLDRVFVLMRGSQIVGLKRIVLSLRNGDCRPSRSLRSPLGHSVKLEDEGCGSMPRFVTGAR